MEHPEVIPNPQMNLCNIEHPNMVHQFIPNPGVPHFHRYNFRSDAVVGHHTARNEFVFKIKQRTIHI